MFKRIFIILIALNALLFQSATARLGTPSSFYDLLDSDVIIYTEASELEFLSKDTAPFVVLKKPFSIKGKIEAGTKIKDQCSTFLPNAKSFLIFLSNRGGNLELKNEIISIIPFGSVKESFKRKTDDKYDIITLICSEFTRERDLNCALIQSYVLASLSEKDLYKHKKVLLEKRINGNGLMDLASINIYIRLGDFTKLLEAGDIQSDIRVNSDGNREVNLFAELVRGSLTGWFYRNASTVDYQSCIKFIHKQNGSVGSDILGAISPYASIKDLPEILILFQNSKDLNMLYECIKNLNTIFEIENGLPTIEDFKDNPKKYIEFWTGILKKK